jgi:F-box interacting protein
MLPSVPSEILRGFSSSKSAVINDKILFCLDRKLHIYRLDTGEYSTLSDLPRPPGLYDRYWDTVHYFGFDTLSSEHEHKVLLVQSVCLGTLFERLFWVFTRGSGSWRQIHPFPLEREQMQLVDKCSNGVVANGAIHFNHHFIYSGSTDKYILAFDMVDMVEGQIRKIPYPDVSFHGYLTQFGGRLALRGDTYDDKFHLWILEDYNNHKWVKETIHLPFGWMGSNRLLAFNHNTGEMLLQSECHLEDSPYFLYYNTKMGTFRRAEVTGFLCLPKKILHEDDCRSRLNVVDVNFDDEMERQKSF